MENTVELLLDVGHPELVQTSDDELLLLAERDHLRAGQEGLLAVYLVIDCHLGEVAVLVLLLEQKELIKVQVVHLQVLGHDNQQEGRVQRKVLVLLLQFLGDFLATVL